MEKKQVEIGSGREGAAPVSADGYNSEAFAFTRIGTAENITTNKMMEFRENVVVKAGDGDGAGSTLARILLKQLPRTVDPVVSKLAQTFDEKPAQCVAVDVPIAARKIIEVMPQCRAFRLPVRARGRGMLDGLGGKCCGKVQDSLSSLMRDWSR